MAVCWVSMQKLRLMTLNIWSHHPPWPTRRRLIQQGLRAEAPDLVGLQEVLQPHGSGTAQADEVAEGLGYRVAFSRACQLTRPIAADYGNALLSRFPIREHRTEPLPTPPGIEPRSLLYALCSVKVGVLPVVVTHLSWEPELAHVRREQLLHLTRYVHTELLVLPQRLPAHVMILPPVLLGDLNAPPDSPELLDFLANSDFVDCFAEAGHGPGLTMDAQRNRGAAKDLVALSRRIDYVMVGADPIAAVRVSAARVCLDKDEAGVFPSDHFAMLADLELPERPGAT